MCRTTQTAGGLFVFVILFLFVCICNCICICISFEQKVSLSCFFVFLFVIIRVISKMPVITWSPSELIKSCLVYLSTCRIHLSSSSTWKLRRKQHIIVKIFDDDLGKPSNTKGSPSSPSPSPSPSPCWCCCCYNAKYHPEGLASCKWSSGGTGLLQMIIRWAATVRGVIGDSSGCMKIDFFLRKILFRTHRVII